MSILPQVESIKKEADALFRDNKYAAALARYDDAVSLEQRECPKLADQTPALLTNRAIALLMLSNSCGSTGSSSGNEKEQEENAALVQRAVDDCERALRIDAGWARAKERLAWARARQRRPEVASLKQEADAIVNIAEKARDAEKLYTTAIDIESAQPVSERTPALHTNRALALINDTTHNSNNNNVDVRATQLERAETDCKAALRINPKWPRAFGRLADIYGNLMKPPRLHAAIENMEVYTACPGVDTESTRGVVAGFKSQLRSAGRLCVDSPAAAATSAAAGAPFTPEQQSQQQFLRQGQIFLDAVIRARSFKLFPVTVSNDHQSNNNKRVFTVEYNSTPLQLNHIHRAPALMPGRYIAAQWSVPAPSSLSEVDGAGVPAEWLGGTHVFHFWDAETLAREMYALMVCDSTRELWRHGGLLQAVLQPNLGEIHWIDRSKNVRQLEPHFWSMALWFLATGTSFPTMFDAEQLPGCYEGDIGAAIRAAADRPLVVDEWDKLVGSVYTAELQRTVRVVDEFKTKKPSSHAVPVGSPFMCICAEMDTSVNGKPRVAPDMTQARWPTRPAFRELWHCALDSFWNGQFARIKSGGSSSCNNTVGCLFVAKNQCLTGTRCCAEHHEFCSLISDFMVAIKKSFAELSKPLNSVPGGARSVAMRALGSGVACWVCGVSKDNEDPSLVRCSGCSNATYCSAVCKRRDQADHSRNCRKPPGLYDKLPQQDMDKAQLDRAPTSVADSEQRWAVVLPAGDARPYAVLLPANAQTAARFVCRNWFDDEAEVDEFRFSDEGFCGAARNPLKISPAARGENPDGIFLIHRRFPNQVRHPANARASSIISPLTNGPEDILFVEGPDVKVRGDAIVIRPQIARIPMSIAEARNMGVPPEMAASIAKRMGMSQLQTRLPLLDFCYDEYDKRWGLFGGIELPLPGYKRLIAVPTSNDARGKALLQHSVHQAETAFGSGGSAATSKKNKGGGKK